MSFISNDTMQDEFLVTPQEFAIMALTAYPSEKARDRLIRILGKMDKDSHMVIVVGRDSPLRGFAALALGLYAEPYDTPQGVADRIGYNWAILTLAERLEDDSESPEVRSACAVGLGLSRRTAVLPLMNRVMTKLKRTSGSNDALTYGYILLGRAMVGDTNVIEPARDFLLGRQDDTSPSGIMARRAAVLALGVMHSPTTIPILVKAWNLNFYVNREVIVAMRLAGATASAKTLLDHLKNSKDTKEQAYMAQAIGELLAPRQPTPLVQLIAHSNYTVRNDDLAPMQAYANEFLYQYLVQTLGSSW